MKDKEAIKLLDKVLEKIDHLLARRSNIIYLTELRNLRNEIVEIQDGYEE